MEGPKADSGQWDEGAKRSLPRYYAESKLTEYKSHRAHRSSAASTTSIRKTPVRFKQLKHMIGNTPLLAIRFSFRGKERIVYAKAEHLNMTSSIKDRMAFHILKKAYQEGRIQPGDKIAEATSGNTGISFAAIGRALGHQVVIFMPDWMSQETRRLDQDRVFSCPHNSPIWQMSKRRNRPPGLRYGGNYVLTRSHPMRLSPGSALAAQSWA